MNEEQVKAKFDEIILKSGLFRIYKEVDGFYIQPRNTAKIKTPRIDRILTPTKKLREAGYNYGTIGIELKSEDHKVGKVLAQTFDYMRAVYCLMDDKIYLGSIMLDVGFVFPFEQFSGALESITKQTLIGTGDFYQDGITLQFGNVIFLRFLGDEIQIIKPEIFKFGKKVGSR